MLLLRGSEESVDRKLAIVGAAVVLCVVVGLFVSVVQPFAGRPDDRISITLTTPYIGEGVTDGTAIVMHGVQIGRVKGISSVPGGGVRLLAEMQVNPVANLTDTMSIDFRPVNYFGVTGINVVPRAGGQVLRDGLNIDTVPKANSTLQALLSRLGEVTQGAVTPKLVSVIDRAVRYTDGLNPLLETVLIALDAVAQVQTVSTKQLLRNATGVAVAFPGFTHAAADAGTSFLAKKEDGTPILGQYQDDEWKRDKLPIVAMGASDIFGIVGSILVNYTDDLIPAVDAVKLLTDPVPSLMRPAEFSRTVVELRTRFEKMFGGTAEQRALQVRIALDSIPGVASPLGVTGAPQ